jgi:hypothetical protein
MEFKPSEFALHHQATFLGDPGRHGSRRLGGNGRRRNFHKFSVMALADGCRLLGAVIGSSEIVGIGRQAERAANRRAACTGTNSRESK